MNKGLMTRSEAADFFLENAQTTKSVERLPCLRIAQEQHRRTLRSVREAIEAKMQTCDEVRESLAVIDALLSEAEAHD